MAGWDSPESDSFRSHSCGFPALLDPHRAQPAWTAGWVWQMVFDFMICSFEENARNCDYEQLRLAAFCWVYGCIFSEFLKPLMFQIQPFQRALTQKFCESIRRRIGCWNRNRRLNLCHCLDGPWARCWWLFEMAEVRGVVPFWCAYWLEKAPKDFFFRGCFGVSGLWWYDNIIIKHLNGVLNWLKSGETNHNKFLVNSLDVMVLWSACNWLGRALDLWGMRLHDTAFCRSFSLSADTLAWFWAP